MSQQDIQDRLNDLHSILSIDHRNTSSFLRTKTSATDNGPSSVSIGITGVILLVFVIHLEQSIGCTLTPERNKVNIVH
jgi:hypothetical protein